MPQCPGPTRERLCPGPARVRARRSARRDAGRARGRAGALYKTKGLAVQSCCARGCPDRAPRACSRLLSCPDCPSASPGRGGPRLLAALRDRLIMHEQGPARIAASGSVMMNTALAGGSRIPAHVAHGLPPMRAALSIQDVVLHHLRTAGEIDSVTYLRDEIDLSIHAAAGRQFEVLEKKET